MRARGWQTALAMTIILPGMSGEAGAQEVERSPGQIRDCLCRERSLASLIEMARWKTLQYALPPFLLLGRMAGFTDAQTQEYWQKGNRRPVIQKAEELAQSARRGKSR